MDKPKILLDTNIVIDFLQKREPFYPLAKQLFNAIEAKEIDGYL
ncbi:PIN domain-containing protein [Psychrobacter sp. I-STPA10]|nr:PIN domain-containing protein [Psychrobacter sp. I-STPA10]